MYHIRFVTELPEEPYHAHKFEAIIDEYTTEYSFNDYHAVWGKIHSIGDCVFGRHNESYASRDVLMPSKRDHHQCCLSTDALVDFVHKLEHLLATSPKEKDFDALWQKIKDLAVKGIGSVTFYDTALRYSMWKGLPEPKFVYIHSARGPLKGAKAYFKYKRTNTVTTPEGPVKVGALKAGSRIDISNFPDFIQSGLDAKNIENLLCIHADALSNLH